MYTEIYICCWTLAESHELAGQSSTQNSTSQRTNGDSGTEESASLTQGEASNTH